VGSRRTAPGFHSEQCRPTRRGPVGRPRRRQRSPFCESYPARAKCPGAKDLNPLPGSSSLVDGGPVAESSWRPDCGRSDGESCAGRPHRAASRPHAARSGAERAKETSSIRVPWLGGGRGFAVPFGADTGVSPTPSKSRKVPAHEALSHSVGYPVSRPDRGAESRSRGQMRGQPRRGEVDSGGGMTDDDQGLPATAAFMGTRDQACNTCAHVYPGNEFCEA
jgi:hypothetical protein